MKVRICYTVDVNDDVRLGIRAHTGEPGKASRGEIQDFYRSYGATMDDDLPCFEDGVFMDCMSCGRHANDCLCEDDPEPKT